MARILVHVEGQSEEAFVNHLLRPYLAERGYESISARLVGNSRHRSRRGGACSWSALRRDIVNHVRQDSACVNTTMVDYYALPRSGPKAWPGRAEAAALRGPRRATCVEGALVDDVSRELAEEFRDHHFVPYVVMHEFEGLLFSDCEAFARGIARPDLSRKFQAIRDSFETPEEINDSQLTAPSKRVESLVLGYQKPLLGVAAARAIGLQTIREECPLFRRWLDRLERAAQLA